MTMSQLTAGGKSRRTRLAKQRARNDGDKAQRRASILAAAERIFVRAGWAGFAMSDVAERAGVVKGTLYLYWPSKEELLLALLEESLARWLDELDARLAHSSATGARKLAAIFADTLLAHAPLPRLLAILQTVLEHNLSRESIVRFKQLLATRLSATAALLEARLSLPRGAGVRLLLQLNALVSGLQQMAETAPLVREVLKDPALAPLAVDFARELAPALETFFVGIESRGRK
jgi:AcrR family transcriptional regulator